MNMAVALLDFVPVVLFLIAALALQRGLCHRMSKGALSMFTSGTAMMICAGAMKALWKLLYNLDVCDFERLNQAFFPMHSVCVVLSGIAIVSLLTAGKKRDAVCAAAPAVYSGTMIFVGLMALGSLCLYGGLGVLAAREKKRSAAVLFWAAFALMLGMGYLSSRDFTQTTVNWITESVNLAGQGCFLLAARRLVKNENDYES